MEKDHLRLRLQDHVPVDAMFPANKDVNSPQRHQDGIPVVVMAQERGDEEREEDGNGPGKKEPRETHLSTRDVFQLHFKDTDSKLHIFTTWNLVKNQRTD